jgi:exonuclease III
LQNDLGWIDAWEEYFRIIGKPVPDQDIDRLTYYTRSGKGSRFDYAFFSPNMNQHWEITNAEHIHDIRAVDNLSDHSALFIEISKK